MKKLFIVVLLMGLVVGQGFGFEWKVESFLLPGINQAIQGRWVEASVLFAMDTILVAYAVTPIEKTVYLSHTPGDYVIVRDYVPLITGVCGYIGMGVIANIGYNKDIISCTIKF